MSADLLLYAIIAAGLIFWLRTILGSVDEDEERDIENRPGHSEENFITPRKNKQADNVVRLKELSGVRDDLPPHIKFDNKTAENNLEDIAKDRDDFELHGFLDGAEQAFTLIIESFAEGDKETLKDLLAPSVYEAFAGAIDQREMDNQKITANVQSIDRMDIVEAKIHNDLFTIALRFYAKEISVTRDGEGNILAGDPDKVTEMVDVWVFGQPLGAEGPEWYLYETRDEEEEEHKTPIPEAGDTE